MRPGGALPSNRLHLLQSRRSSICHVSAEEANRMLCPPGSQLTRRYMTLLLIFFSFLLLLIFLPSQVEGLSRPRRGGGVGVAIISVCGFQCGVWCTAVVKLEALFRSPAHCPVIYLFFFLQQGTGNVCHSAAFRSTGALFPTRLYSRKLIFRVCAFHICLTLDFYVDFFFFFFKQIC